MHPLDAITLDDFAMTAATGFVVHRPFAEVWRLLGLGAEEPTGLPEGVAHRIVARYGPGEHRCSTIGAHEGRTYCARGLRRVLGGHEVLELQRLGDEERLVRTTYRPLRFGRTAIAVDAGQRAVPGHVLRPEAGARWNRVLAARRVEAERYLIDHR
jgi:hypothetical protein